MDDECYLGDAVYVSYDGFQLKLRCEAPSKPNTIFLDSHTYGALLRFVETLQKQPPQVEGGD